MNSYKPHWLTFVVEIGNTRTHIGLVSTEKLNCRKRLDFPSIDIKEKLPVATDSLLAEIGQSELSGVMVAGCIKTAVSIAGKILSEKKLDVKVFAYSKQFPIEIHYADPFSLGSDRIANCLYAKSAYPGKTCVLISAGTAITVDLMKSTGEFMGGAILPGINTQFKSLHISTDALPLFENKNKVVLPGRSTQECMSAGVLYGTAGALQKIIAEYKKLFKCELILSTGGSWEEIAPFTSFDSIYIPDMTIIGTALYSV